MPRMKKLFVNSPSSTWLNVAWTIRAVAESFLTRI